MATGRGVPLCANCGKPIRYIEQGSEYRKWGYWEHAVPNFSCRAKLDRSTVDA